MRVGFRHIKSILIFQIVRPSSGYYILDFAGPFEVFSVSYNTSGEKLYDVALVAENRNIVKARNNFLVQPNYSIEEAIKYDMVVIPGGYGTRPLMQNEKIKNWIKTQFEQVELMLSVCTGSLVLAASDLLKNMPATTHHLALGELKEADESIEIIEGTKYVDNGKIITAGGISAGIEMALHVVERHHGKALAEQTAKYMEYDWDE